MKPSSGPETVRRAAARCDLWSALAALACGLAAASGCAKTAPPDQPVMKLELTSPAFAEGQPIPAKCTCDDQDASPPLAWKGVPATAQSLALIADDPDAPVGTWVHWVLYDLPPATTQLPENLDKSQYILGHAKQGLNDFRRLGYGGPCPPRGKAHRYFFKLYALDKMLDLNPGATKKDVLKAMAGHVLAEGQLMGTYQRR